MSEIFDGELSGLEEISFPKELMRPVGGINSLHVPLLRGMHKLHFVLFVGIPPACSLFSPYLLRVYREGAGRELVGSR
jgi:hypothetical protein